MKKIRDNSFIKLIVFTSIFIFLITIFFLDNDTQIIRYLIGYYNGTGYYDSLSELMYSFNFLNHVDSIITWTFAPYQIVMIPLISVAGVILFKRLNTIFPYESTKYKSRKEFFIKKSFLYSFGISLSIFMTYLIFLLVAMPFLRIDYESGMIYRSLFVDILGEELYFSHREIYYILEGATRFLFIPFVYSLLSCATAFYVNKKYLAYFIPVFFWFGLMAIGYLFYYIAPSINQYFSPTLILATSSYKVNTFFTFLPHLLVLGTSIYLITKASRDYEF